MKTQQITLTFSIVIACGHVATSAAAAGPIDSLDDVVFWTGSGTSRAAIVIDFAGESATDSALAWGYRWDGAATGRDMLDAVVQADTRLFAVIGNSFPTLNAILGLGYDRNDDGKFELTPPRTFDDVGFAYGAPTTAIGAVDSADWYREGWEAGFWHYAVSRGSPLTSGDWVSSQVGASRRSLANGDWDSWAFSSTVLPGEFASIFAQNPVIATPPNGYADFDSDSDVDGADFLIWQRGVGLVAATPMQGDANGDGLVGARDLEVWRATFGRPLSGPATLAVAEPVTLTTCASALFLWFFLTPQRNRRVS
jgi:hypothetical protein